MSSVTIRVPATTANLGPGFDAFGCALSLYTDVTFEETDAGLEITGCDEAYTGPDNLAYTLNPKSPSAEALVPPPPCWWPVPWGPTCSGATSSPPRVC